MATLKPLVWEKRKYLSRLDSQTKPLWDRPSGVLKMLKLLQMHSMTSPAEAVTNKIKFALFGQVASIRQETFVLSRSAQD